MKVKYRKELAKAVSPDAWAEAVVGGKMQGFSRRGRRNLGRSAGARQASNKSNWSLGMGSSGDARSGCNAPERWVFSKTETDKTCRQE